LPQPCWNKVLTGGITLGARYFHSGVYEPDLDLLLVSNGINTAGSPYRTDTRRLDCAGGWWLQTGAANGIVQVVPNKACFQNNEHATLVASPSGGAAFNQWLGDASGNANPLDVMMSASKNIFADIVGRTTGVEDLPLAFAIDVHPNPTTGPAS